MITEAIRTAMRAVGSRAEVLDTCPICGGPVTPAHDRLRIWPGKLAHRRCAEYESRGSRRGHHSPRVHSRFTRS